MYVDNIPYIDKSAFDFNFYDIERIDILRGPQGTLYGRNTMGGLVKVHTRKELSVVVYTARSSIFREYEDESQRNVCSVSLCVLFFPGGASECL